MCFTLIEPLLKPTYLHPSLDGHPGDKITVYGLRSIKSAL